MLMTRRPSSELPFLVPTPDDTSAYTMHPNSVQNANRSVRLAEEAEANHNFASAADHRKNAAKAFALAAAAVSDRTSRRSLALIAEHQLRQAELLQKRVTGPASTTADAETPQPPGHRRQRSSGSVTGSESESGSASIPTLTGEEQAQMEERAIRQRIRSLARGLVSLEAELASLGYDCGAGAGGGARGETVGGASHVSALSESFMVLSESVRPGSLGNRTSSMEHIAERARAEARRAQNTPRTQSAPSGSPGGAHHVQNHSAHVSAPSPATGAPSATTASQQQVSNAEAEAMQANMIAQTQRLLRTVNTLSDENHELMQKAEAQNELARENEQLRREMEQFKATYRRRFDELQTAMEDFRRMHPDPADPPEGPSPQDLQNEIKRLRAKMDKQKQTLAKYDSFIKQLKAGARQKSIQRRQAEQQMMLQRPQNNPEVPTPRIRTSGRPSRGTTPPRTRPPGTQSQSPAGRGTPPRAPASSTGSLHFRRG